MKRTILSGLSVHHFVDDNAYRAAGVNSLLNTINTRYKTSDKTIDYSFHDHHYWDWYWRM